MKLKGNLSIDDEGQLCIKTQISPQNPELYDIQIRELCQDENLIGKDVKIEIFSIKKELKLD